MKFAARILLLLLIVAPGMALCQGSQAETWESLRDRLVQRRESMQSAVEMGLVPQHSEFKEQYIKPEYAQLYRAFVKLNPKTGLLEYESKAIRPFFTIYSQPKPDGGWIINIPEFDYDLLEKDFARMKQAGINVQPRFWNWSELLNYDGTWKQVEKQPAGHGLPFFKYVFEIYDYFLDRAQAHGLYVNIEPSFYWGLHPEVVPPQYRGKILLYDELWDATSEAYARIMRYYSKRTVIIAAMVGEEDLIFDHCLDDMEMSSQFKRYIRKKYGTVSNLQRTWTHGYNYADHSKWATRKWDGEEVLWPEYPFVKGAFDSWQSFDDVRLPVYDHCRSTENPDVIFAKLPTRQNNLLHDPAWIDFMNMKEQMLISRLNGLADAFRSADPNHILYYSNPHDFNPAWHMLHCFDRGKLNWDIIGVGQHDHGIDPSEVPHWASCREYVKNVSSYVPYIGATGAYAKGFACGEGEGGKTPEGRAKYYPWWLTDIVGGGGAFFQSYHWNQIAGRTYDKPTEYDEATLDRIGDFLASIRNTSFTRKDDAQVLILRNKHAAYGMSAGYDFGNARYLANILYQLHIPFDILPDSDVTPGVFEQGKVNLNDYRFIFIPAQNQLLSSRTWQMIEDWISDPRYAGQRGLCFGLYQDQDCYFNPAKPGDMHPAFTRLTGTSGYSRRIPASGIVNLRYARFVGKAARGDSLDLQFPENGELGCFDNIGATDALLTMGEGGPAVVLKNTVNGNPVYTCGFYLGLAYNAMWGLEKEQNPYNLLNPLYMGMLESAGLQVDISAPDNLGVYVADDASLILVKERFGKDTDFELGWKKFPGVLFGGVTTIFNPDGSVQIKNAHIGPYETLVIKKAGGFTAPGVTSVCKPTPEGGLDCTLTGKGKVNVTFGLKPKMIYSAWENGELAMMFTADAGGIHNMAFNLGNGSKPLHILIKPSKRR